MAVAEQNAVAVAEEGMAAAEVVGIINQRFFVFYMS